MVSQAESSPVQHICLFQISNTNSSKCLYLVNMQFYDLIELGNARPSSVTEQAGKSEKSRDCQMSAGVRAVKLGIWENKYKLNECTSDLGTHT